MIIPPQIKKPVMRTTLAFSALLFAPLFAQDSTAKPDAAKPNTIEVIEVQGRRLALVRLIPTAAEFQTFQQRVEAITNERKDTALTKQLLDAALTTPEKEARQRQLDAKMQKLVAANAEMNKAFGFDLTRQYVVVPTKLSIYQLLTDDEYVKLAASSDFKKDSVIEADGGKKLQSKGTVTGAVEVETFQIQIRGIGETKKRLQELLDLQPKLTKPEDKKKVEEAIQRGQKDVNEAEANFATAQKYVFSEKLATQIAEAKLYVLLSDEENKQVDKAVNESKKDAPAAK
jgi:hypothetical protein